MASQANKGKDGLTVVVPIASVLIAIVTAYRVSPGILFSDEYIYAKAALALSEGTFQLQSHHFYNRFGLLLPMAVFVKTLGSHLVSFVLPTFLDWLCLLAIAWWGFRKELDTDRLPLLLSFLFCPALFGLAADISPDMVLTTSLFLAFTLLWHARQARSRRLWLAPLVGFWLFYGFFTKMTALFCFPFFLGIALHDLWNRPALRQFWLLTGFSFVLLLLLNLGYYQLETGDSFYRFAASEGAHSAIDSAPVGWNYRNQPFSVLLQRVTLRPIVFLIGAPSFGLLGAGLLVLPLLRWHIRTDRLLDFALLFLGSGMLCFWLGSSSLQQYNPVILVERMWLPLLPPLLLAVVLLFRAYVFSELRPARGRFLLYAVACTALAVAFPEKQYWFWPGAWAALVWAVSKIKSPRLSGSAKWFLLLMPWFLIWTVEMVRGRADEAFFQERVFLQTLSEEDRVFTDRRALECADAYFNFGSVPLALQPLADFEQTACNVGGGCFIMVNEARTAALQQSWPPPLLTTHAARFDTLAVYPGGMILVYVPFQ